MGHLFLTVGRLDAAHGAVCSRWLTDDDVSRPARRAREGGGALTLMPILTLTLLQSYTQLSTDTESNLVPSFTCGREPFVIEQQLLAAGTTNKVTLTLTLHLPLTVLGSRSCQSSGCLRLYATSERQRCVHVTQRCERRSSSASSWQQPSGTVLRNRSGRSGRSSERRGSWRSGVWGRAGLYVVC